MWLTCSTRKGNKLEKVGLVISIGEDVLKHVRPKILGSNLRQKTGCMIIQEAAKSKDLGMLSNSLDLPKNSKNRNPSFQLRLQRWWNPRSWLVPWKLSPLCLGWFTGKSTMVKFQANEFQYCNHFQQLGCPDMS